MPNRLVVLVCLVFHKILMGLDCKFFEFPFLMCFLVCGFCCCWVGLFVCCVFLFCFCSLGSLLLFLKALKWLENWLIHVLFVAR